MSRPSDREACIGPSVQLMRAFEYDVLCLAEILWDASASQEDQREATERLRIQLSVETHHSRVVAEVLAAELAQMETGRLELMQRLEDLQRGKEEELQRDAWQEAANLHRFQRISSTSSDFMKPCTTTPSLASRWGRFANAASCSQPTQLSPSLVRRKARVATARRPREVMTSRLHAISPNMHASGSVCAVRACTTTPPTATVTATAKRKSSVNASLVVAAAERPEPLSPPCMQTSVTDSTGRVADGIAKRMFQHNVKSSGAVGVSGDGNGGGGEGGDDGDGGDGGGGGGGDGSGGSGGGVLISDCDKHGSCDQVGNVGDVSYVSGYMDGVSSEYGGRMQNYPFSTDGAKCAHATDTAATLAPCTSSCISHDLGAEMDRGAITQQLNSRCCRKSEGDSAWRQRVQHAAFSLRCLQMRRQDRLLLLMRALLEWRRVAQQIDVRMHASPNAGLGTLNGTARGVEEPADGSHAVMVMMESKSPHRRDSMVPETLLLLRRELLACEQALEVHRTRNQTLALEVRALTQQVGELRLRLHAQEMRAEALMRAGQQATADAANATRQLVAARSDGAAATAQLAALRAQIRHVHQASAHVHPASAPNRKPSP